jgi:hypothetical protein
MISIRKIPEKDKECSCISWEHFQGWKMVSQQPLLFLYLSS